MPLDPTIANPATIKLNDPLEQYSNFLRAGYLQSEIAKSNNALAMQQGMNQAWRGQNAFIRNPDGTISANWGGVASDAASRGAGALVPQLMLDATKTQAQQAETKMNLAKGENYKQDAFKTALEQSRDALGGIYTDDPNVGLQQLQQHYTNESKIPIVAEKLQQQGLTPDQYVQQHMDKATQYANAGKLDMYILGEQNGAQGQLNQLNKQKELAQGQQKIDLEKTENQYTQVKQGPQTTVVGMRKYGQPSATPVGSYQVGIGPDSQNYNPLGKAIQIGTQKEVEGLRNAALGATRSATTLGYMIKILDAGNAVTGTGAQNMNKLMMLAKAAGFNVPQSAMVDTQTLSKYLNQNVMDRLANMPGLSRSTNMKLAQINASSPQLSQDPATIRQLLMNEWRENQNAVGMYNTRAGQVAATMTPGTPGRELLNQLPEIPEYGAAVAKGTNGRSISSESIIQLINNPSQAPHFDQSFGAGSAAKFLGGSQQGSLPFQVTPLVGAPR